MRESVRKRRKRKKIGRMILTAILIIAMLAGLCAILIWKVFVVKSVSVKGNEIYTDKQIEDWVLDKSIPGIHCMSILKINVTKRRKSLLWIPFGYG